jgi:hypothetical protein
MPWMPEVFTAPLAGARRAEARREEDAARTNDAIAYYEGILAEELDALIRSFAGQPRVSDPRVGHVEGKREFRAFVSGRWTGWASATPWLRT